MPHANLCGTDVAQKVLTDFNYLNCIFEHTHRRRDVVFFVFGWYVLFFELKGRTMGNNNTAITNPPVKDQRIIVCVSGNGTTANIGEEVTYIRHKVVGEDGAMDFDTGTAVLHGVFVNEGKRLMARLMDDNGDAFNVHWYCVNAPKNRQTAFKAMCEKVSFIQAEGNDMLKSITADANAEIDQTESSLLGDVLGVD